MIDPQQSLLLCSIWAGLDVEEVGLRGTAHLALRSGDEIFGDLRSDTEPHIQYNTITITIEYNRIEYNNNRIQ